MYNGTDKYDEFIVGTTTIENRYCASTSVIKLASRIRFKHGIVYEDLFDCGARAYEPDYNYRARETNHAGIRTVIDNLFYNTRCIRLETMPIVDRAWRPGWIKNYTTSSILSSRAANARKWALYDAGLTVMLRSVTVFGCARYTCRVCGIIIVGNLNPNPIIDHIAHSPYCALVRLRYNVNHVLHAPGGPMIVYANNVPNGIWSRNNDIMRCKLCFVQPSDVLCMDCAHVDMCRSCFMVMKTCGACDMPTTEFCLLNVNNNRAITSTLECDSSFACTGNVNLSDASVVHESQMFYAAVPCMHVFETDDFTMCKMCCTLCVGTVCFRYAARVETRCACTTNRIV